MKNQKQMMELFTETPDETNEEKLDFGGRTMNVVTTSEKICRVI